jgi:hypothetical protein
MINDSNDLWFYGSGNNGNWYNSTPNGGMWNGYVATNIQGGDPGIVMTATGSYLMIYVGQSYTTGIQDQSEIKPRFCLYPNPANGYVTLEADNLIGETISLYNALGKIILSEKINPLLMKLDVTNLSTGIYIIMVRNETQKLVIE